MRELKFFHHLKIRRKQYKRHSHKLFLLGFLLLIVLSTLYVWQRVMVIKLLKEVKLQKFLLAQEEKKYKYLNIELAELYSVERIEKIAKEKLGMIYPSPEQIIFVEENLRKRPTLPGDLWAKFKGLGKKLYLFEEKGSQAKEIKHDL